MKVRPVSPEDSEHWLELRDALWPNARRKHAREIATYLRKPPRSAKCFVSEVPAAGIVGFVEVGLRDYAEGCSTSPVGYLEGIFVAPDHRSAGVGQALVSAAEEWARQKGCSEMASDQEVGNGTSGAFHVAIGYEEVGRIVCFRKTLEAS